MAESDAGLAELLSQLGDEVEDPDEETFLLYAQPIPSHNLGFIDPKAPVLELAVAGRDLTLYQSPTVLSSNRPGGTTGAVFWKLSALLADWLASPSNALFATGALSASSAVLELGCGVSPLAALALAPRVASCVLSDQPYVQKLLQQNLDANPPPAPPSSSSRSRKGKQPTPHRPATRQAPIRFQPLDWETDDVANLLPAGTPAGPQPRGFDAVLACDCVYNYALVPPFVQACADACALRSPSPSSGDDGGCKPCLCVVAQQLRNDDVFRSWLAAFHAAFRVWRVPDGLLPEPLRPSAGFVIHVGVLRDRGP